MGHISMIRNIWIWNHYSTDMFIKHGGRHYWISKQLIHMGYNPIVFGASTIHNSDGLIPIEGIFKEKEIDGIKAVFVKARKYSQNRKTRVLNMVDFYVNIKKTAKILSKKYGKPDVIYASSVHPLTLIAGIQVSKAFKIPCICEVRDPWPESIIAYGLLNEKSLLARLLYRGEHWIYRHADALIFTYEGGKLSIKDKKWDKQIHKGKIDLNKIFYINNGIDVQKFDYNRNNFIIDDEDLQDNTKFKCVYAGSIRLANNLDLLVETAKWLQENNHSRISILIYGTGDHVAKLEEKIRTEKLNNIKMKGFVDKKYIPYVISQCDLALMNGNASKKVSKIMKYGQSLNKSFDYLAAGKPIIHIYSGAKEYDYIEPNGAGLSKGIDNPEEYGKAILKFANMEDSEYLKYCINARKTVEEQFDFGVLTNKFVKILEFLEEKNR